jgi:hypothetical protein
MSKDPVVMRSKQIICDILGLVLDMDMEMRLSRMVAAFNRGDFKGAESEVLLAAGQDLGSAENAGPGGDVDAEDGDRYGTF